MPPPAFGWGSDSTIEEPIRAELFGVERLEQHATTLARAQRVVRDTLKGSPLLERVRANGRVLRARHAEMAEAVTQDRWITPAAEWLLDNFYIVDEQLREIRDDLPVGFYRELPKLVDGPLATLPRVYGIAWAFAAHTDSRFDPELLRRFVDAYQHVDPLTIGELWAVAITLRVVLVENLRRCAEAIARSMSDRQQADTLADELLGPNGHRASVTAAVLEQFEDAPMSRAFTVELMLRLRDRDPAVTPALVWLNDRLAAEGTTADDVVNADHQQQAAMTVTVRNLITSMRLMSAFDWAAFVERVSLVDRVLRANPTFAQMDFASRDAYRHAIEQVARGSRRTELDVARAAITRSEAVSRDDRAGRPSHDARREDPGYYLVGGGRRAFERQLGFRSTVARRLFRAYIDAAIPGYLGSIALLTAGVLAVPLYAAAAGGLDLTGLVALGVLGVVAASDLAIALVNRSVTAVVPPSLLSRLELPGGAPPDLRTLVVVPTLLLSLDDIEAQIERLEVHYLANSDGEVLFALLTDWTDAPAQTGPDDDALLASARQAIARLNRRHATAPGGHARFYLLHRRRVWNARQGAWMGWERKRGKLHELNRLLRGATDTTFVTLDDDEPGLPPDIRYVVTLDSDTRIPIGAVTGLVGTMAHPLNRPRFDHPNGRVVEGYAILQPRVTPPLPGRAGSFFQQLMSGPSGIDPYASAVSDVYQDIFNEGTFTGKGIYDVDAFEAALAGRVPENRLLSHDLYEGIFARAGLVTDIEVFEQAPASYTVAAARQHRWARGDWQLLPWLVAPKLPLVARWKILDNLRRTLSAPMMFLTVVVAWTWPGASPLIWTDFLLATIAIPMLIPVFAGVIPRGRGISKRSHVRAVRRDLEQALWQTAVTVTMLAHQAWLMTDAIVRTLARVFVTRRNLLEWTTAAQAAHVHQAAFGDFVHRMAGALVLTVGAAALILMRRVDAWPASIPLLLLWASSPLIAHRISVSQLAARTTEVTPADARTLRLIARRTWRFFATFVGPDDRWLAPDNFQETPSPIVARRTSPTNLGLSLLSTVAARDFGWIGLVEMVERLEATLASMRSLDRHRGHWYNWYGTQDGRALEPRYISSVDSGNLAGALIALGAACREMIDQPFISAAALVGVDDTASVLRRAIDYRSYDRRRSVVDRHRIEAAVATLTDANDAVYRTPADYVARLHELATAAQVLREVGRSEPEDRSGTDGEFAIWTDALVAGIASHQRDLGVLAPWAWLHADAAPSVLASLAHSLMLSAMPGQCDLAARALQMLRETPDPDAPIASRDLDELIAAVEHAGTASTSLIERLAAMAHETEQMVESMEFDFLFDRTRKLFSIGYRIADDACDPGWYDLLASEARLLSYIAIAKGDVPVEHWFRLGRVLTPVGRDSVLMSWSGSMFEYLMPALLLRTPFGSLLEQTCRLVVQRQIAYGAERDVPWGVSESGYSARDLEMTYKYSAFGVPGLGLRRGLGDAIVITPHATGLAAMIDPAAAVRNFGDLRSAGASGPFGFYEAIDYTAARRPPGARSDVVRSYMTHHQGMILVAITNALQNGIMRSRFHAAPMVQASEMLLQERTPRDVAVARPRVEVFAAVGDVREPVPAIARRFASPHATTPRTNLLSNGRYAVMITSAGAGYSRWSGLAITRWREDVTLDDSGTFLFVRDVASGESWSAAYQPRGVEAAAYDVSFREDRAEITRRDGSLITKLEVIVSAEDDAEVRLLSLTNHGSRPRELDVTSYAEIVLAPHAADLAHPAFSNLFVHTEGIPDANAVLATRRQRSPDDAPVWLGHSVTVDAETVGPLQWETDRLRFIGRGNSLRTADGAIGAQSLSNTSGPVLDPIVSLRRRVRIPPGKTIRLCYSTFVARSREAVLDLADTYHDWMIFDRVATLAWTRAQVQMHHVGIGPNEAHLFQELAGPILYADRALRAPHEVLTRQHGGGAMLWAHGISGDLPIVLVDIDSADDVGLVRQLLRAHEYWRMKRLAVDVVILNDRAPSYLQDLQLTLQTMVRASPSPGPPDPTDVRGGVFLLRADQLTPPQRDVLYAAARVVVSGRLGSLADQMARALRATRQPAPAVSGRSLLPVRATIESAPAAPARPALECFNGLGGFANDGREYVIVLGPRDTTPLPWINVIANERFGCLVSESGAGCTWADNSQSNRLTPWSNDPVSDPASDVMYVRDEERGTLWTATALPIREANGEYVTRHGPGYTRHERVAHGMRLDLVQFVPPVDPIKISRLVLTNQSERTRRLSVTAYAEWVLGSSRAITAPQIVTEIDAPTGALFAHNSWNADFAARVAFADLRGMQSSVTGDRGEFVGRHGSLARPAALDRGEPMRGKAGAGRDPCAALQQTVVVRPGEVAEVVFFLGEAATREDARDLLARYRTADLDATLAEVTASWNAVLDTVTVTTPDRAFDLMLNGWLVYQTLACRLLGRAAFYQSSGAYGFRDQLQDVMAVMVSRPDLARQQLLRAASRQFVEGDVQHWWHPPTGRGVRTRCSDDLLWLPYVAMRHLEVTADATILDQMVRFIDGPPLSPEQMESYFEPRESGVQASLFEHCARAIDRSLPAGPHGLPLIGGGDWNDGMNRVGIEGRGESVWLGWFLHTILADWAPLAEERGDMARAAAWRARMTTLAEALERDGWDGAWYRRAYFDDGTPLGSQLNTECRIDAIAQSWSVIAGVAPLERQRAAMASLTQQLVKRDDRLVLLLTPPFDQTPLEPGYIKGYLPGIRENGAQYTHAAAWAVIAHAMLGDGNAASELFGLINPIGNASTPAGAARYKAEPYVLAGDVYSTPPHVGRGGWSWYTGSAAWLYRAGLESIAGFQLRGTRLVIDPCIPTGWPGFTIVYRHHATTYRIAVENPDGVSRGVRTLVIDGAAQEGSSVELVDDGGEHQVQVVLG